MLFNPLTVARVPRGSFTRILIGLGDHSERERESERECVKKETLKTVRHTVDEQR